LEAQPTLLEIFSQIVVHQFGACLSCLLGVKTLRLKTLKNVTVSFLKTAADNVSKDYIHLGEKIIVKSQKNKNNQQTCGANINKK
jgi:hypothetical protein